MHNAPQRGTSVQILFPKLTLISLSYIIYLSFQRRVHVNTFATTRRREEGLGGDGSAPTSRPRGLSGRRGKGDTRGLWYPAVGGIWWAVPWFKTLSSNFSNTYQHKTIVLYNYSPVQVRIRTVSPVHSTILSFCVVGTWWSDWFTQLGPWSALCVTGGYYSSHPITSRKSAARR